MKLGQENCKIYIVIFENSLYNAKIRKTVKEEKNGKYYERRDYPYCKIGNA